MELAEELEAGSIGFMWQIRAGTNLDLKGTPDRGHVHTDGPWAIIETLEEDAEAVWMRDDDQADVEAIAAMLATGSALFLEVQQHGFARHIGGWRASSTKHRARMAIGNVPFDLLKSPMVHSLEGHFFGVSEWAGISAAAESFETDERGHDKSWSVRVESPPPERSRLFDRRAIVLEANWSAKGPIDQRMITTPIAIRCESRVPRPAWDLLQPLLSVQDLLSFIHGGLVVARAGAATLDLRIDPHNRHQTRWPMWNGALMTRGSSAPSLRADSRPYFRLPVIGGVGGLSRWVKLWVDHPRAMRPILNVYRRGPAAPEVTLLDAAAGIEYWINTNRKRPWADKAHGSHAAALARHVGAAFQGWVGDDSKWAEAFRQANNGLKHDPAYSYDPELINDLAVSGRLLLASALLNQVARNRYPSRGIFDNSRVYALGSRLRRLYS